MRTFQECFYFYHIRRQWFPHAGVIFAVTLFTFSEGCKNLFPPWLLTNVSNFLLRNPHSVTSEEAEGELYSPHSHPLLVLWCFPVEMGSQ